MILSDSNEKLTKKNNWNKNLIEENSFKKNCNKNKLKKFNLILKNNWKKTPPSKMQQLLGHEPARALKIQSQN